MAEQTKTMQKQTTPFQETEQNPFTGQFFPIPDYKYSLSQQEYLILNQVLQAFAMPLAVMNTLKDRAVSENGLIPVFKNDLNEQGQVKQEFIDKHFPKKDNSIIIDPNQN